MEQKLIDIELERSIIEGLFIDLNASAHMVELRQMLLPEDFTDAKLRKVWSYICKVYDQGQPVTPLNIYTAAKAGGDDLAIHEYMTTGKGITADTDMMGDVLHYIGQRRRLVERVSDIMMDGYDDNVTNDQLIAALEKAIKATTDTDASTTETFGDVFNDLLKATQDKAAGTIPNGVPSGFELIDKKGGLERGELMIIAGRNSNGKTSLALTIALNAAKSGEGVGIFSLEMTNLQLTTRLASLMSGVDGEHIKRAEMVQDEWQQFVSTDSTLPIYFDKRRSTDADALVAGIKGMVARQGVQVVVVDYLQLLRSRERERIQQIGGIAHRLEALSKQLGITIILLSQLRRNRPEDPTPKLEELKESGDIADAADSIYLVYRPERHGENISYPDMSQQWSRYTTKGTALLMCVKNRNGQLNGEQLLGFDAPTTRFFEKESFEQNENEDLLNAF